MVPDLFYQTLYGSVQAGILPKEDADRYRAMFAKPAGDKFLGFLENELHPLLAAAYRIDESDVGLWGFSYGGLFTSYVALKLFELVQTHWRGQPVDRREGEPDF
ncbi:alpha/beta hydrolase-fold protein (plasmid) [Devosia sp. A8/3-2]|nr:alpha/beta hydrolase-fold protein [Devosia sp. A8/3-2]